MERENFIKTLQAYKDFLDTTDKLMELGIDLAEGPISRSLDIIFDAWLNEITNEGGQDLIYWWLFEDVEKVIRDTEDNVIANIESIENLYNYLKENEYFTEN